MPTTTPSPTKVHPTTNRAPQEGGDDPERLRSIHDLRSVLDRQPTRAPVRHLMFVRRPSRDRRHAPRRAAPRSWAPLWRVATRMVPMSATPMLTACSQKPISRDESRPTVPV